MSSTPYSKNADIQLQTDLAQTIQPRTLLDDGLEDELALLANSSSLEDPITYNDAINSENKAIGKNRCKAK